MTGNELLERAQWDTFWCPDDVRIVDRPELLYLTCPRSAAYLNIATRVRAPAHRLPALVAEVGQAHAHTTSRWSVTDTFDEQPLVAVLAAAGYREEVRHRAVILPVDDFRPRPEADLEVRQVASSDALQAHIAVMEQAFEQRFEAPEAELRDQLRRCTEPGARTCRFTTYDRAGRPLAAASMNLYPRLELGLLWGGGTVPAARGRGAYSALVAARVRYAQARGIRFLGLYARVGTSAPIVARQGFHAVGAMSVWHKPPRVANGARRDVDIPSAEPDES